MVINKLIKAAIEQANKSQHRHRVGAVIYDKNGIVSAGYNQTRSVKHFTKQYIRWPNSIHAEVDAILKAKTELKGKDILIVRLNKKGQLRLAKPCSNCLMYLEHVGINTIRYSNNEGGIEI